MVDERALKAAFQVVVAAAVIPLAYAVAPIRVKPVLRGLVAPSALILLALAISILLGTASYLRNYWILSRQWVASTGLVPVGVVWLGYETYRQINRLHWIIGGLAAAAAMYFLAGATMPAVQNQSDKLWTWMSTPASPREAPVPPDADSPVPTDNEGWIGLANRNIEAGGQVWPVFRVYYTDVIKGYRLSQNAK